MTISLLDQKTREMNWHLQKFRDSESTLNIFLVAASISVFTFPLLGLAVAVKWVDVGFERFFPYLVLCAASFVGFFYWNNKQKMIFRSIQACAFALEQAGFVVYKNSAHLECFCVAVKRDLPDSAVVMDFFRLTLNDLVYDR
jgi:hypothetical protein